MPLSAAKLSRTKLAVKWAKWKVFTSAIVLVMVAIGMALLYVEHAVYGTAHSPGEPDSLTKTFFHEAGMAVLIAAVVGVALDFIALGSGRFRAELVQEEQQELTDQALVKLKEAHNKMVAMTNRLEDIFPRKKCETIHDALRDLAMRASTLKKTAAGDLVDDTNIAERLKLVTWLTNLFPTQATENLTKMLKENRADDLAPFKFEVPGRYQLTRRILAMQLDSMKAEDVLCSLANPLLYRDIVPEQDPYLIATRAALLRGVKIRRIFNLLPIPEEDRESARTVIQYQLEAFGAINFRNTRSFECRFLTDSKVVDFEPVRTLLKRIEPETPEIGKLFYALFVHKGQQYYFYRTIDSTADIRLAIRCIVGCL